MGIELGEDFTNIFFNWRLGDKDNMSVSDFLFNDVKLNWKFNEK